jgi:chromatin segregation and condensation protein Rec8/ScpA/Scc1 (kleisin family)
MASRLMALKVRELLPKEAQSEEELLEFSEDREQLLREMLEYQRYKQVAKELQEKELENFGTFIGGA